MKKEVLTLYHSRDLDGWCSAAIVQYYHELLEDKEDYLFYYVGWDYGDPIPENLYDYHKVIMCDVSFPKEVMGKLFDHYGVNFLWIDHHVSALKENNIDLIHGIQNDEKAACELTWEYFFPHKKMPEFVWYLGMYDSFRLKGTEHEENVLRYQYGARAVIDSPEKAYWHLTRWDDSLTPAMLNVGEGVLLYLQKRAKQIYARSFPMKIDGYKFLAVNEERFNPITFGIDYHKDGYDGFASFFFKNGKWEVSLYSDNGETDVSDLAKIRGGGGHFGAAGFIVPDINYYIKKPYKSY